MSEAFHLPSSKKVLMIITGGIAAYKTIELTRTLVREGLQVRCVLTAAASHFVTPLTLQSLTGEKVYTDLFSLTDEQEMGHIALSRWADIIVVCPATAHIMAKAAHGLADDLASTLLLVHLKSNPVILAPAMNVAMWHNPSTQRNLLTLQQDGYHIIEPEEGEMACHEYGVGRLASLERIYNTIRSTLQQQAGVKLNETLLRSLPAPLRILITAGPTHEPIDPIRFISNHSSGQQGYALAKAFQDLGQKVILVSGPTPLRPPPQVEIINVKTALEMHKACMEALPVDIAIMVAAVSDWRVQSVPDQKIKKQQTPNPLQLTLVENPDILAEIAQHPQNRPKLVIGFAAETENIQENALQKLRKKKCDWIIANDVSPSTGIMGGEENQLQVFTTHSEEGWSQKKWPRMKKQLLASYLAQSILEYYNNLL